MRRPQEQPHAEPILQLGNRLGDCWLTDPKLFRSAGK
jgi:hypothetical protein